MKQIVVLPTWILVRLIIPFLSNHHLLKNSNISLKNWAKNSTELNTQFSVIFWVFIFLGIYLFAQLS